MDIRLQQSQMVTDDRIKRGAIVVCHGIIQVISWSIGRFIRTPKSHDKVYPGDHL